MSAVPLVRVHIFTQYTNRVLSTKIAICCGSTRIPHGFKLPPGAHTTSIPGRNPINMPPPLADGKSNTTMAPRKP